MHCSFGREKDNLFRRRGIRIDVDVARPFVRCAFGCNLGLGRRMDPVGLPERLLRSGLVRGRRFRRLILGSGFLWGCLLWG